MNAGQLFDKIKNKENMRREEENYFIKNDKVNTYYVYEKIDEDDAKIAKVKIEEKQERSPNPTNIISYKSKDIELSYVVFSSPSVENIEELEQEVLPSLRATRPIERGRIHNKREMRKLSNHFNFLVS